MSCRVSQHAVRLQQLQQQSSSAKALQKKSSAGVCLSPGLPVVLKMTWATSMEDDVSSIDRLHTKDTCTTVPCVPKGKHLTGGRDKQRIV